MESKVEKTVTTVYNVISWVVWAVTIVVIFGTLFLLITGPTRRSELTAGEAVIERVPSGDEALAANGKRGENWYRITVPMQARGSRLSPFSYEMEDPRFLNAENLRVPEHFTVCEDVASFSAWNASSFTFTLYVRFDGAPEDLIPMLRGTGLSFKNYWQVISTAYWSMPQNAPSCSFESLSFRVS